jgi:hypothetical protein
MAVPPVAARDARFAPCRLGPSPPSELTCHCSRGCTKAGAKILQKIAQNLAANLFRSRFFTQPLSCSSPIARFGQHVKIVQLTIGDEVKVQLALEHADIQVSSGNVRFWG